MYREYGKWWSSSLGREMEFLWFGQFGRPVMLFPTSGGRFYENEERGLAGSLADKVDRGEIQLILIDAVNEESWYNTSIHPAVRVARHLQYDAYLRHEMAPYITNRAQRGVFVDEDIERVRMLGLVISLVATRARLPERLIETLGVR
jgi:esterase/lipase superfamily enzyme